MKYFSTGKELFVGENAFFKIVGGSIVCEEKIIFFLKKLNI